MTFDDGTPRLAQGIGGLYPEFDQVESLSNYVNSEYRLEMSEAW